MGGEPSPLGGEGRGRSGLALIGNGNRMRLLLGIISIREERKRREKISPLAPWERATPSVRLLQPRLRGRPD